jgi:hypothetical protein
MTCAFRIDWVSPVALEKKGQTAKIILTSTRHCDRIREFCVWGKSPKNPVWRESGANNQPTNSKRARIPNIKNQVTCVAVLPPAARLLYTGVYHDS